MIEALDLLGMGSAWHCHRVFAGTARVRPSSRKRKSVYQALRGAGGFEEPQEMIQSVRNGTLRALSSRAKLLICFVFNLGGATHNPLVGDSNPSGPTTASSDLAAAQSSR